MSVLSVLTGERKEEDLRPEEPGRLVKLEPGHYEELSRWKSWVTDGDHKR